MLVGSHFYDSKRKIHFNANVLVLCVTEIFRALAWTDQNICKR